LRRERQGLPPRGVRQLSPRFPAYEPRRRLPLEPFVQWLLTFPDPSIVAGGNPDIARRIYAYLHGESKHVALDAADAILIANGLHLHDVYSPHEFPALYEVAA
jgi:hypothetical protein